MSDKKDKEGKEALTKDVEGLDVTPPVDGLRRSRSVRNLPPPPPPQPRSEVGGSRARNRKRPTGPPEQGNGAKKKKVTDEGDVSAKVTVANREGAEWKEGTDKMLLVQKPSPEPILRKNGQTDEESAVEAEDVTVKGREASVSLSIGGDAAVGAGSSETQSSQEGEAHPCLFIDNILEVVFKHIINQPGTGQDQDDEDDHVRRNARDEVRKRVQKDVRNIRLVCKTWKTSITPLYRQTGATATLDGYSEVVGQPTLTKFLDTMRPSEVIPVQKYNFLNGSILDPKGEPKLFREFLVLCGPEAASLDLKLRSSESEKIMLNLVDLPELNLAKLTRLKLTLLENRQVAFQASRIAGNVKLIELLLTAAKNLREFELSYPPPQLMSDRDPEVTLNQQLVPVIAKRLPASVKQLTLNVEMNESCFNGLAGIQSQLRRLELDLPYQMGSETICKFLQSQAATLQHLHLSGSSYGHAFVGFPRLHELVHLEISGITFSITAPFEVAEIFPKLQSLKIEPNFWDFLAVLSSAEKPLGSLKVLHLPSSMSYEPGVLKGLAKSLPCLTELRLGLYFKFEPKERIKEVFTYFDNLELLNITGSSSNGVESKSMLSGIAESECSARDFEKESMTEIQRQPSLLNLTKLRKLVVRTCSLLFTDFLAHFVFLQMDNLRELHLLKRDVKFSPKYRELLEAKLDKLVLLEY